MSRKHQEKQQARARARREQERAEQRSRRNIWIGIAVVAVLTIGGVTWWALANSGDDPVVAVSPTPSEAVSAQPSSAPTGSPDDAADSTATPSEGSTAAPATEATGTETTPDSAPCPPPTGAPEPDTSLQWDQPPPADIVGPVLVTIETTCGTIMAELDGEAAPQTVSNFVFLADNGFYVGTPFHRVIADFMIQGGDPTGTGNGGPGYSFDDELALTDEVVADNDGMYPRGTVAMANSGPNTNGSQYFIVQADPGYPLDPNYAIFGQVTEGMEVVDNIANGPVTGPQDDQAVDPARVIEVIVELTDETP